MFWSSNQIRNGLKKINELNQWDFFLIFLIINSRYGWFILIYLFFYRLRNLKWCKYITDNLSRVNIKKLRKTANYSYFTLIKLSNTVIELFSRIRVVGVNISHKILSENCTPGLILYLNGFPSITNIHTCPIHHEFIIHLYHSEY